MKTRLLFLVCASLFAPLSKGQKENPTIMDLSTKNTDFAMNLYRKLASHHDDNIFFSPLCMSVAFTMLSMAAKGDTYNQILKGLNLQLLQRADQADLIPELFRQLEANITQNQDLILARGSAMFVHQQFEIDKIFSEQIKKFFNSDIMNIDFSKTEASKTTINDYVKMKTNEKVMGLISQIDPLTQLVLVNTILFQGKWELPFNSSFTEEARFYVDKYNIVKVPMMFREDKYYLAYDPVLKLGILKLPYRGHAAMLVLLPDKGVDYTSIDDEISAESFLGWIQKLKKTKLEVQLPRFKMEQSYNMDKILPDLGIRNVFENTADLSGLSKEVGLKVSEVLHKAVIEVDEKGTEAAGATATGITGYSMPPRLIVDRPFLFLIYHEKTNSILFMGRVIDPTKN
ncbi:serpin peptidase inhibitor, clade A (alpha-1 antiproteinase, antitrypsin), member 10a [Lepisosteus oculatus]|uniref:serpin peptidase inhibitor, clade A (alpha-1 antiproteinase, antitrypsin), member 10a n=1 Tax=Lepisosteus oculatus TaxID=7918 RepID=UPI0003EA9262|nr:PREDICTED: protein Z-dependent protease inhibitor [Lepisosteus oculatus]